jgi:thiopurine S-methyltransferase
VQAEFWLNRWRASQIGFHQAAPDKHLKTHWPSLQLTRNSRVFVPLCGKSLDLLWLEKQGHNVAGVELSPIALESFCLENGIPARRRLLTDFDIYETDRLTLYRGDFFKLTSALLRNVSAIYDRAAFISWTPALRPAYVEHLTSLIPPGAQLLLITVEFPEHEMGGPPFSATQAAIHALYAPQYSVELLSRHEILDLEPRLRARGLTELSEIVYRLTRL